MVLSPEWTAPEGVPKNDQPSSFHGRTAKQQAAKPFSLAEFSVHIRVNGNLPDVAAAACRTVLCDAFEFIQNRNPFYLHSVYSFDELLGTYIQNTAYSGIANTFPSVPKFFSDNLITFFGSYIF